MKTTISYKFDLESIKSHIYFSVKNDDFESVYFIPINNQMLFIGHTKENLYLTLSYENNDILNIKDYIQNTIEWYRLKFDHIFEINKEEFRKFLKNGNKKDTFFFDLIIENESISGYCCILKNKKDINNNPVNFIGEVKKINSEDDNIKRILEYIIFRKFNFKETTSNKDILNINLKYYGLINNLLNKYKGDFINIKFFDDEINNLTSVNINIEYNNNIVQIQILILHIDYTKSDELLENNGMKDILSNLKKSIFWVKKK